MLKKRQSLIVITLIVYFVVFGFSFCFSGKTGTTAAQFLKIAVGARATALGETYTAISDDVTSIYWNSAGLNLITNPQVSAMHAIWLENIFFSYLAGVYPTKFAKFGMMVNYLSMDAIDKYNRLGNKLNQTYTPSDLSLNLAVARNYKQLNYGITLKYIHSKIEEETASALGMDIGLIHSFMDDRLSVGFTAKNIGTQVKFITDGFPLPLSIRTGVAYRLLKEKNLLIGLDVNSYILESLTSAHVGIEYVYNKIKFAEIALRAGYKTNTILALGSSSGITAGVGFVVLKNISVDYAWVAYGNLGNTHRISINYTFP